MKEDKEIRYNKVGEFVAYSIFAIGLIIMASAGVAVSYFLITWAFGLR